MSRVVVLTGATGGVGRATARALAAEGAAIALVARDTGQLQATAEEVRALGGRALALPVDVADAAALDAAAARVEEELGPIDVWINDAMASVFAFVREISADEFRRVTETTYLGYVNGTLSALARMLPRGSDEVVTNPTCRRERGRAAGSCVAPTPGRARLARCTSDRASSRAAARSSARRTSASSRSRR